MTVKSQVKFQRRLKPPLDSQERHIQCCIACPHRKTTHNASRALHNITLRKLTLLRLLNTSYKLLFRSLENKIEVTPFKIHLDTWNSSIAHINVYTTDFIDPSLHKTIISCTFQNYDVIISSSFRVQNVMSHSI